MSYMGLDIGTSGCKTVVFNENGEQTASAYREYKLINKTPGWAEIDSKQVCRNCLEVIKEAALKSKSDPVKGIGISSQGEAFTPVDAQGNILSNALVSSDTRATAISKSWSKKFGAKKLYNITGHTPHPMFSLFKLIWLKENLSQVWSKTDKFLCFEDLVQATLGLEPAIAWPLAGRTMMFDIKTHAWNNEILGKIGLDKSKLARPLQSGSVVGEIPAKTAGELGLSKHTIVVAGGHDQPCGALGAGVIREGAAMYATGTVECITPVFSSPVMDEELYKNNLCTYDYTLKDMYTTVAFSLTGGNILKWFREQWAEKEVKEAKKKQINAYELILRQMDTAPSGLLVLPYFTPSGTPYFDLETPGTIYGLRLETKKADVLRALLEGVALEMKLNIDILDKAGIIIHELRAIGGGAKNQIWTQLKADVLNKPITTVRVTEAGCLGTAMLACAANEKTDINDLVNKWVKTGTVVEPNPANARCYQDQFPKYQKLYKAVKGIS